MKTLNVKISFLIAGFIFLSSTATFAMAIPANSDSTSTTTYEEGLMSDIEMNEILNSLEEDENMWLNDTITYNIYDSEDNLISSSYVKRTAAIDNTELVKLISQSDLLMNHNNTLYYRLAKK